MKGQPALPLLVQAYRGQGGDGFITDKRCNDLDDAVEHAQALFKTWGRKVRVIDQAEFVWFFMPERRKKPRGTRAPSTRPARPRPQGNRTRRYGR